MIDFVAHAKAPDLQIINVFIHLESTELNQALAATRVSEGGHGIPCEKVISRIPQLMRHVYASISLVDVLRLRQFVSAGFVSARACDQAGALELP